MKSERSTNSLHQGIATPDGEKTQNPPKFLQLQSTNNDQGGIFQNFQKIIFYDS